MLDLDQNSFGKLRAELGGALFEQLIADATIQRSKGTYKGAHGLSLDLLVPGGYLFVLAIGETSPGRYRLTFQGAWRMA